MILINFYHTPYAIRHTPYAIRHTPYAIRHTPYAKDHLLTLRYINIRIPKNVKAARDNNGIVINPNQEINLVVHETP